MKVKLQIALNMPIKVKRKKILLITLSVLSIVLGIYLIYCLGFNTLDRCKDLAVYPNNREYFCVKNGERYCYGGNTSACYKGSDYIKFW